MRLCPASIWCEDGYADGLSKGQEDGRMEKAIEDASKIKIDCSNNCTNSFWSAFVRLYSDIFWELNIYKLTKESWIVYGE